VQREPAVIDVASEEYWRDPHASLAVELQLEFVPAAARD
jgi:hypothetical protein